MSIRTATASKPLRYFPGSRPNIDLDFRKSKKLDGRIEARRATSGTGFVEGKLVTFPTDTARLTDKGLLVEEERTNLVFNSEDFTAATWTKTNITVTANQSVAPDGTTTADLIYPSSTASCNISRVIGSGSGSFTNSIFAKAAGINWIYIYNAQGNARAWFDLSTGTKGSADASISDYSIIPYGNGWYRCDVRTDNTTYQSHTIGLSDADNSTAVTVSGTNGVYVWGAQFEAGLFSTSYIPTTTAAVTRATDVVSITGDDFSSWFNQDEGTAISEVRDAEETAPAAYYFGQSPSPRWWSYANGYTQIYSPGGGGSISLPYSGSQDRMKYAVSRSNITQTVAGSINGQATLSSTQGTITGFNQLMIGRRLDNNQYLNGHLSRLAYHSTRVPDTALQVLTN